MAHTLIILQVADTAFREAALEASEKTGGNVDLYDLITYQMEKIFGSEVAVHGLYGAGCHAIRQLVK